MKKLICMVSIFVLMCTTGCAAIDQSKMMAFVQDVNENNTAGLEVIYTGDGTGDVKAELEHLKKMIPILEANAQEERIAMEKEKQ